MLQETSLKKLNIFAPRPKGRGFMVMKLKTYAEFIKIEHTLFALPFAYIGALLASKGWFGLKTFILIFTAFTGLRTAAMSFNRIIDREIDALNPRTAKRHIPAGIISLKEAYAIAIIGLIVYFISASFINELAFMLSPIPAIVAYIYPYLKRYTCLCHYFLGLNLAFAPLGGWIAVTNSLDNIWIILLSVGVMFWVAGFDIMYGLQDLEFDREYGLHSIGAHFGVKVALAISALNHLIFFLLVSISLLNLVGISALFGLIVIGILLIYEHILVRKGKIQVAFFHINAVISVMLLIIVLLAILF